VDRVKASPMTINTHTSRWSSSVAMRPSTDCPSPTGRSKRHRRDSSDQQRTSPSASLCQSAW
jgi:hypothetical protein